MPALTRKSWTITVVVVLILGVTYPLAPGPLFYLNGAGYLEDRAFETLRDTVFAPCLNLADSSATYFAYLYWWMERGAAAYAARTRR